MTATGWMIAALPFIAAFFVIAIYNTLIALNRRCDQAAADIDVQVKLRHDLVPNLVSTVKGYAAHENATLEAVMKARSAALTAQPGPAQVQAEAALSGALGRLMAVAEAYPDLKASASFAELQAELGDIENKIAAARRYLNNAITEFNTAREQFPANVVGSICDFAVRDCSVIANDSRVEIETVPSVKF